ncbi:glycosyltransferase [Halobacterium salinarum]|uniref:glycosyltransferase n=1 Tax=Halobacterium salinarum TaxID=2242 RepID=UPI002552FC45|nr:glycosyltransferase [Halobacterium salinarum]MDL0120430.1 glycosyltransferase [Halobacterium salinarum]
MAKVAFLVKSFPKLSETFILHQITGLIDAGHEVDIYALDDPGESTRHSEFSDYDLRSRTTYLQFPKISAGIRVARNVTKDVVTNLTYLRLLLRHGTDAASLTGAMNGGAAPVKEMASDYDAVHAHFGPIANAFVEISSGTDTPFIASFYGFDASEYLRKHPRRYQPLFEAADTVTVLSEDMRSEIVGAGCPPEKTRIVPLPIDTTKFTFRERQLPEAGPVKILTVARLVEKKGVEYAIDAVSEVADEHDVEYIIAGDGPLRESLERRASDIDELVSFRGWVDSEEVQELMSESHIFMLPSVTASSGDKEGTPTALLEAQASGLPVISTRHAGIPAIVQDGDTGILVPERNSGSLADAISELIGRGGEWPAFGREGRNYIEEKHSVEAVTEKLTQSYSDA